MSVFDLFRLDGKIALVTGCKRGIGRAMATALAEAGADIIGVSATLEPEGSQIEREVTELGRSFNSYTCDLGNRATVYGFLHQVQEDFSRIDILVNNAGTILRRPAAEYPDEYWDRIVEINLTAQFILAREIGKTMVERGKGKIVFNASILAFQGGILVPSYAASKGGIVQLTRALSNEWAARGVNVNAIAPGYVATDTAAALRSDPLRSKQILERIPAGRWGVPEDFKGAIVYLCSPASDYVHGSILTIDGGWMGR